ncbi:MAG: radical SAM protein [bacterium]
MSQLATSEVRARERRAAERFRFTKKLDAPRRVCLAYANRYPIAMGNLGFQVVYELFDKADDVVCERAFLPDEDESVAAGGLRTLESGWRVSDCDLLALSISFETDYLNVPRLLELAGLPARRSARGASHPLVIAGGPAIFLNPEPIADFVDAFLIGEGEELLPEFLAAWREAQGLPRAEALSAIAARVRGVYVPDHFTPEYDGERLVELHYAGPATARVERRLVWDLNQFATTTRVLSDEAVFGDMVLVEASRGCQWGCRFCAAGYMYRPIRTRDPEQLEDAVLAGLDERRTIGLVGAEMASMPGVDRLAELATARGGRLSPSSLKADCVTPRLAAAIAAGGARSVTVAPEAGSDRMRRVINKNLSEADILRAADLMAGEGVQQLKCYFMVGLPTETDADVLAIAELTDRLRARLTEGGGARRRVGAVTISLNAFVPKPWTPFQWDPMESIATLRGKAQLLRKATRRIANLTLDIESPREAYLQTILSRGDRRVARFIDAVHAADGDWWRVIRTWQRDGLAGAPHPDAYVHRTYAADQRLPWDFIDHRIAKSYLWSERRKALTAHQTAPCDTSTCRSCAAC